MTPPDEDFVKLYLSYTEKTECPTFFHRWVAITSLSGYIITKEDLLFMVHNPRCVSTMLEALTPRTVSWDVTTLLNPAHKDISKEEFEAKYLNYWEPESDDSTR